MREQNDVAYERLRIALRLLIGASAANSELLTDENWQAAMSACNKLVKGEAKNGNGS